MSLLIAVVAGIVAASYLAIEYLATERYLRGWRQRLASVSLVGFCCGIVALAVLVPLAVLR